VRCVCGAVCVVLVWLVSLQVGSLRSHLARFREARFEQREADSLHHSAHTHTHTHTPAVSSVLCSCTAVAAFCCSSSFSFASCSSSLFSTPCRFSTHTLTQRTHRQMVNQLIDVPIRLRNDIRHFAGLREDSSVLRALCACALNLKAKILNALALLFGQLRGEQQRSRNRITLKDSCRIKELLYHHVDLTL
jgi:hypothetical protein